MSENSGKRVVGPFQIEDELGVGGMGIVYRAIYLKNGTEVAVKLLAPDLTADPKVAQRFVRETEILKKLKHPNIIRYYGAGASRTQRFYAMELLHGGSLDQLLRKKGKLSWEETIHFGVQIAKALEHAHNAGIVHRDLKPGNLLLTKEGVLKLSDFGIARDTQATALTQAGKTVGTMIYMAPEQITGKHPISRRTDLYALGCVLFQMLTGRTPFVSETSAEIMFKHLDEVPPSVLDFDATIPLGLARLVDELLAKDPNDRPFDALAVQVRLQEIKAEVQQKELAAAATGPGGATAAGGAEQTMLSAEPKKRRKKKKKRKAASPVYEQTWFLASGLALLLAIIVWTFVPESEAKLYSRAKQFMTSNDPGKWINAEEDIDELLARFPDGEHAGEVRRWKDQIDMYRAERAAETNIRFGREPQSEAERLFVEAQQYEKFGDRLTALEKYEAMPKVIESNETSRPYLNLARRQAERIRGTLGTDLDRTVFIQQQLDEAEKLYLDGKKLEAREKWTAIVRLYGDNPEFEAFVAQARRNLQEVSSGDSGSVKAQGP